MRKRKVYHSSVKLAYSLNLEKVILPASFLKSIPRSTVHGWRHDFNPKSLIGQNFAKKIEHNLTDASAFLELTNDNSRTLILTVLKINRFFRQQLSKNGLRKLLRDHKQKTIQFIDWLDQKTNLGKTKISASIGLGRNTVAKWKRQIKFTCHTSVFAKCRIEHPNQATINELSVITELLSDPTKSHWGIPSLQGWAIKKKLCFLSVSSWYTYNRLLKIRRSISRFKKSNGDPLRATKVNEIWHADITVFKTLDGVKNYIYTIKDNFSRKTLVWKITEEVSAQTRLETIQQALLFAFPTNTGSLRLITDGGPENDNQTIKNFICHAQIEIKHQIALRDIVQSNSMVEATYRWLKSSFLYGKKILNAVELEKYLQFYFHDHDEIKPHSAHQIYTPNEVYNGANPAISLTEVYQIASKNRRITNLASRCKIC